SVGTPSVPVAVGAMSRIVLALLWIVMLAPPARAQSLCNYRDTIMADTPYAYWRFNEIAGTFAQPFFDEVGNGHPMQWLASGLTQLPGALAADANRAVRMGAPNPSSHLGTIAVGLPPLVNS